MTDPLRYPDTDDNTGASPDRESAPGTPWGTFVLVFVVIVLVLGFVLLHVTGVVGPGSH